jgi:hypothetical protein
MENPAREFNLALEWWILKLKSITAETQRTRRSSRREGTEWGCGRS